MAAAVATDWPVPTCTGHHASVSAGVRQGSVGSVVAVVGDGAVGLCAGITAKRLGASRIIALPMSAWTKDELRKIRRSRRAANSRPSVATVRCVIHDHLGGPLRRQPLRPIRRRSHRSLVPGHAGDAPGSDLGRRRGERRRRAPRVRLARGRGLGTGSPRARPTNSPVPPADRSFRAGHPASARTPS